MTGFLIVYANHTHSKDLDVSGTNYWLLSIYEQEKFHAQLN